MDRATPALMFRVAAALFFLGFALVAKVRTSECHCTDPGKSKKAECPFGAARSLAGSILEGGVEPVLDPVREIEVDPHDFLPLSLTHAEVTPSIVRTRAPPRSLHS